MVIYSRAADDADNDLQFRLRRSIELIKERQAMAKKNLEMVVPDPLPPVEEVAKAITEIAVGMKKLNASRLKRDAVVILLQAQCGSHANRTQIRVVLNELERMDKVWLKPLEKKEGK